MPAHEEAAVSWLSAQQQCKLLPELRHPELKDALAADVPLLLFLTSAVGQCCCLTAKTLKAPVGETSLTVAITHTGLSFLCALSFAPVFKQMVKA